MTNLDLAYTMRDMPLFADLKSREIALLSMVVRDRTHDPGHVICREGDPGDRCFFIVTLVGYLSPDLGGAKFCSMICGSPI